MFEYTTKVRIDLKKLNSEIIPELRANYDLIGTRDTHEGRSRFTQWNNISKFSQRLSTNEIFNSPSEESTVLSVTGSAKGNTARIYFKPSVTGLAKAVRKCIIPINNDRIFAFFDLRAAEFAMTAIFAQETEAVAAYQRGEDIYMHYKNIFPENTGRAVIKKILIANMYNKSAYSTAIDLGITETQARRLLESVAAKMPRMTMFKKSVYAYDLQHKGYYAPKGFDQTNLVKVADFNPVKGFNPDLALSCYTQSALGFLIQETTKKLQKRASGTILSVFDSILAEIHPNSIERYSEWIKREMSPLIPDEITTGKTFWEAAYKNK